MVRALRETGATVGCTAIENYTGVQDGRNSARTVPALLKIALKTAQDIL